MINRIQLLSLALFVATVSSGTIYAQNEILIKNGKEDYSIGRYISILEDRHNALSILQAASDSMKNKYTYKRKETLNYKFTGSSYWVRLVVVDTTSNPRMMTGGKNTEAWLLVKNDPIFEDVRLFYKGLNSGDNVYSETRAGSIIPPHDKSIKINDFIGSFPVRKNVPDTVYLRLRTKSQFIISFNLLTAGEYVIRSSQRNFFHGILFGIFFLLIAYNTLLYSSIKDKTYLFYVLYILSFALAMFTYEGYYFDIFGRTFNHDYFILPMSIISLQVVFWLLFTREFLSIKTSLPLLYKPLAYLTVVAPAIDISTYVFSIGWLSSIWSLCILIIFLFGFVVAVITLKKGIDISRYYLLASSGLLVGIIIQGSARNGFFPLPYNFWTQNAVNLGILWEALILAATVGYRFNYVREQKEKEKSLMRSQIAADLHDEVGSYLSTISLQSRLMIDDLKQDHHVKEQLREINKIAGRTTEIIRDIVWFINPFHDNSEDMFLRMKELASKMLANLTYTFQANPNDERIFEALPDLNKRRHLYLIFKEALNNIIKHSEADTVSILLSTNDEKFLMVIADNGKGFNGEKTGGGEGLNNLRNRAAQIGAQIVIESNNGRGTTIALEVPL